MNQISCVEGKCLHQVTYISVAFKTKNSGSIQIGTHWISQKDHR